MDKRHNYQYIFFLLLLGIAACNQESRFKHSVTRESKPWTHEQFDAAQEKFTFAIFSDLTGGERPGIFNVAIQQLNLLRPDMIINVGDLIEGDFDKLPDLHDQWDSFDERANKARAPIFYVGGNHDLNKEELRKVWEERYAERYYHFVYRNVLFLVLDTEDNTPERMQEIYDLRANAIARAQEAGWEIFPETEYAKLPENTGGNISKEQTAYFQNVINEYPEVMHTFLFMHKAPWKIEDPEFVAIEEALSNRPYTVFNGHVHTYLHEERKGRDYIRLATTGGVQFPAEEERSMDHVMLVTVDKQGVDMANVLLAGILDKTGHIPLEGDSLNFERTLNTME